MDNIDGFGWSCINDEQRNKLWDELEATVKAMPNGSIPSETSNFIGFDNVPDQEINS